MMYSFYSSGHFVFPSLKNCPWVPEWHQADFCSGYVRTPELTKKPSLYLNFMVQP